MIGWGHPAPSSPLLLIIRKPNMSKVFIPNKSGYNFEKAKAFGDLIFLTEGHIDKFKVNEIYQACVEGMKDATPDDFIMLSTLGILNIVAGAVFARKTGRLNILMFKSSRYEPKQLDIDSLLEMEMMKGKKDD